MRSKLLRWYRVHKRDLPWRRRVDPYSVWVSEIMLQQTRVETVVPYYEAFLKKWPSVFALAEAKTEQVRAAWSGLGYYRRAELMLRAAKVLANEHQGRFPTSAQNLQQLPGFGRYTAGAVASIAQGEPTPAVDGNVARVLARTELIKGDVLSPKASKLIWAAAEQLVSKRSPGNLNQSLIELGALVCTRKPKCECCPLKDECQAYEKGLVQAFPEPRKKPKRQIIERTGLLIVQSKKILLEQQPEGGLFSGLWCLPMLEGRLSRDGVYDEALRSFGVELEKVHAGFELKHILTHRDFFLRVYRADASWRKGERQQFFSLSKLHENGIPSLTRKALERGLPQELKKLVNVNRRKT